MENASKALIMAGAVLIAIMIISLSILIFNKMSGTAKQMANMDKQEIAAFNSRITPYVGETVPGSQVNALLQYCLSVNMAAKRNNEAHKIITVSGVRSLDGNSTNYDKVATGSNELYKVKATQDSNGLFTIISITK